jgi:threonine dehydratase
VFFFDFFSKMTYYPTLRSIQEAATRLRRFRKKLPLQYNKELSSAHLANVSLWRGDQDIARSFKWRGAFNAISAYKYQSVVTCSAGNHAQGVAFSCNKLGIPGTIFMPFTTTMQKIDRVKALGGNNITIILSGANFDSSVASAVEYAKDRAQNFLHPFDDEKVIEGQATVGLDLDSQDIDYLFVPIGGGGLCAGVSSYMKYVSPKTRIIGVEPLGAPTMYISHKLDKVVTLDVINTFVDGAAVKRVGELTYPICEKNLDDILLVDEGHVCSKIIQMYNQFGYVIEPAGALSLCALDIHKNIRGRNVVSLISGGNSDASRMGDFIARSYVYENSGYKTRRF